MDVQDFILLLLRAQHGNRVDRSTAARILTHAFPLMTWEPGEGDVLVIGKGVPPLDASFRIDIRAFTES